MRQKELQPDLQSSAEPGKPTEQIKAVAAWQGGQCALIGIQGPCFPSSFSFVTFSFIL